MEEERKMKEEQDRVQHEVCYIYIQCHIPSHTMLLTLRVNRASEFCACNLSPQDVKIIIEGACRIRP